MRQLDDFLLALLAVALADVVLFHFGAYFPFLQPDSYSGIVERLALRFADRLEAFPGRNRIVVMGNSKTLACVRMSQLEAELAGDGLRYHTINLAVGGSTPRSWYVLLRDGRITGDNTEIVVLGINHRLIEAYRTEKLRDLEISKTRLRIADGLAMAMAYRGLEDRLEVFSDMVYRTPLFRDDVRQFLVAPTLRIRKVRRARFKKQIRVDNRSGRDLLSARLGKDNKLVFDELDGFLKGKAELRKEIQRMLRYRNRLLKAMAKGRRTVRRVSIEPGKVTLLGRLVEDLNAEGIKVVFSVVPAFPYSLTRPVDGDPLGKFFRDLERRGADAEVWHDPEVLRQLHSPEYFRDTLHLNAKGAEIYTRGLARFLGSVLSPQQPVAKVSRRREREIFRQVQAPNHRHTGVFRGFGNTEMAEKIRSRRGSTFATGC